MKTDFSKLNTEFTTNKISKALSIAGISLRLLMKNKKLANAIAAEYKAFIVDSPEDDICIDIHCEPNFQRPNPDSSDNFYNELQFSQSRCKMVSNHFEGYIDTRARYGELIIDSTEPLGWLEHYLRIAFAVTAQYFDALLFYGAGHVKNGCGDIFFGPSGAGKSTVTMLSPNCTVLGDDMIVLKRDGDTFQVCATPFNFESNGLTLTNMCAPIRGFYRLIQDTRIFLHPMPGSAATADLLANMPIIDKNPYGINSAMVWCHDLLTHIPCYELYFTRDNTFWRNINEHIE